MAKYLVAEAHPAIPTTPANAATREAIARPATMAEYRPTHIDAKDAIAFAAMRIKHYYDANHQPKVFQEGDLVNIRLHKGYHVPAIESKKIGPQLVDPLKVLDRIGRLAYRLELPDNMRIHDVISVIQLNRG